MVEKIRPPITVIPIGARQLLSPLIEIAVGSIPATIATVVITIGWARLCPASQIAAFLAMPWFIISTAKSTSRIEFLATIPNSIKIPISTNSDTGWPAMCRAIAAPNGGYRAAKPQFVLIRAHRNRRDEHQDFRQLGAQLSLRRIHD